MFTRRTALSRCPQIRYCQKILADLGDIMNSMTTLKHHLHETEEQILCELRAARRALRKPHANLQLPADHLTFGQRVADSVASTMGSWPFIIVQTVILFVWIVLNITAYVQQWDPYPFILLNLALSFQAAYAAPFIMMSQNRQQDIDRKAAECDYQINIKAELEIELLHQKLDQLREREVALLTESVKELTTLLSQAQEANRAR
ncbi:MAG TPA: DUF1003 domain-containing protein [Xanthobacteraceae bacterium]|nr:DUF1003 domain-containing protein [Xanthobacteraceae bacterium]